MKTFILLLALMVAVPSLVFATKIKDIDVSPKNLKVGDTVKILVKTSGDVARAVIEFPDLNIKKDLAVIGKNAWGIAIPLNNPGEKKFKVLLYKKKNDKDPKDTEKEKFVVSAKNDVTKPIPAPVTDKQKPVPVVQVAQQQYGSVSGRVHNNQMPVVSNLHPDFTLPAYRANNPFWNSGYAPKEVAPPKPKLDNAKGNCTWYANGRLRELGYNVPSNCFTHDAKTWVRDAKNNHIVVDQTPQVGSIAQSDTMNKNYGHVAVVEAVHNDGTILISESSYAPGTKDWDFLYNTRTVNKSIFTNYIHVPR